MLTLKLFGGHLSLTITRKLTHNLKKMGNKMKLWRRIVKDSSAMPVSICLRVNRVSKIISRKQKLILFIKYGACSKHVLSIGTVAIFFIFNNLQFNLIAILYGSPISHTNCMPCYSLICIM